MSSKKMNKQDTIYLESIDDFDTLVENGSLTKSGSTVNYDEGNNHLVPMPEMPTVNNGTLTITQGGVSKGTFSANQSGNTTVALDGGVIWEEY